MLTIKQFATIPGGTDLTALYRAVRSVPPGIDANCRMVSMPHLLF